MAFTSRFADEDALHKSVPRCPLAQLPPSDDESACAACRYNVCFEKTPQIGCHMRTPADVMERARASLEKSAPHLARELATLRAEFAVAAVAADADGAVRFRALAEQWLAVATTEEEREVASVILRFSRGAAVRPVEILR